MTRGRQGEARGDSDELLSAYMDGALSPQEAAQVRERLQREPELARRLEALEGVDRTLRAAFAGVSEAPLPEALRRRLAREDGDRFRPPQREGPRQAAPRGRAAPISRRWAPLAAAAGVAFVVGVMIGRGPLLATAPAGSAWAGSGRIEPGTPLHEAVTTTPSRESRRLPEGRLLTPQLTFRARDGSLCRTLTLTAGGEAMRSVACRTEGSWAIRLASFGAAAGGEAPYAPASRSASPLDRAVDAMMEGEPLDARSERALIAAGWERSGAPKGQD